MSSTPGSLFTSAAGWTVATVVPALSENHTYGSPEAVSEYDYHDPPDDAGPCEYKNAGAYFLPVLYSVFFVVGLAGNALVLWVVVGGARLRSMTDVCLLNLALADLLLICSLPFLAHHARHPWPLGDAACKVVLGVYHVGFYGGIFFITLMSMDRYLAIVHAVYAMRTRTRSFGALAAAVTWVAAFLAAFPDLAFLQVQLSAEGTPFCAPAYATGNFWPVFALFKMNVLGLLVPALVIGFCYGQIVRRLLRGPTSRKPAVRLVLVVVAAFFCCWAPYNVASFFKALELLQVHVGEHKCDSANAVKHALQATEAMAYFHSCLNPLLYMFVGEKFRRHLLRLINRTTPVFSRTTSLEERSTVV